MQLKQLILFSFVVCVAAPVEVGAENSETGESIRRFSGGLTEILRRHVNTGQNHPQSCLQV